MTFSEPNTSGQVTLTLRQLEPTQLHNVFVRRWRRLADQSGSPNPFLGPDFVLPYLTHCRPANLPWLMMSEDAASGELVGLGIFDSVSASTVLPLPHLVPLACPHQYRDGLLVDQNRSDEFFESLFQYFQNEQDAWFGIAFHNLLIDEPWVGQLKQWASRESCSLRLAARYDSPAVDLHQLGDEDLDTTWSSSRRKTMRKNRKKLEKFGDVQFRLLTQTGEIFRGLNQFLLLEHSGWKRAEGTSLLSNADQTEFIREMVAQHAIAGNLLLSELTVAGQVAAAAINVLAADHFYAFKIGWDETYAAASPGTLHEWELIRTLRRQFPHVRIADSCSLADSYLSKIWLNPQTVGSGLLSFNTFARGTGKLVSKLRQLKKLLPST